jgi:hypothetical protein
VGLAASLVLVMAASNGASVGNVMFHDATRTSAQVVRLGNIADLSSVPISLRPQAAALALFETTPVEQVVGQHQVASRARSLMPALGPWLSRPYSGVVRIEGRFVQGPKTVVESNGPDGVVAGAAVITRLRLGIYTIERNGLALQPAKFGERLFVRTSDGVLSAYCCEGMR